MCHRKNFRANYYAQKRKGSYPKEKLTTVDFLRHNGISLKIVNDFYPVLFLLFHNHNFLKDLVFNIPYEIDPISGYCVYFFPRRIVNSAIFHV